MERPKAIKIAVALMSVALGIRVSIKLIELFGNHHHTMMDGLLYIVPDTIISLILIVGISGRRRWAQIGYLILFVLDVLLWVAISTYSRTPMISIRVVAFWYIIRLVVLYLLFKKESAYWFKLTNST